MRLYDQTIDSIIHEKDKQLYNSTIHTVDLSSRYLEGSYFLQRCCLKEHLIKGKSFFC